MSQSFAFNVENVMLLEAYEDFHEIYRGFFDILKTLDDHLGLKSDEGFSKTSKLYNPILDKHRRLFCGLESSLTVTKSALFCFYSYAKFVIDLESHGDGAFNWFLRKFQYMVARILIYNEVDLIGSLGIKGNWQKMDAYFIDQINARISSLLQECVKVRICEPSDSLPLSKEELHLYYNLTTTKCRLKNHEIVPEKYVSL